MTKSYDLSVEGHGFVPFCLTASHRHALRKAVASVLRSVPGAVDAALSAYSPEPSVWELPPFYSGDFGKVSLQQALDAKGYDTSKAVRDYEACVTAFVREGWSQRVVSMLHTRIGRFADSPHTFDKSQTCVGVFSAQYALALSRAYRRHLFVDGDTLCLRLPVEEGWAFIGLVEGVPAGTSVPRVSGIEVFNALYASRGEVTTNRYGAYDRVCEWLKLNSGLVNEPDGMRLALTLLKLSCHEDEEVEFEQALRRMQSKPLKAEKPTRYTFEVLEGIRDTWLDFSETPVEALKKLYPAIVPEFLDSQQFKRMFGVLPSGQDELNERQIARVNAGLDKFCAKFLKRSRE